MKNITQNKYRDKQVLILGLGLNQGGVGSAKFFAKNGAVVRVTDLKNENDLKPSLDQLKKFPEIEYVLGEHRFEDIDWADLIIRNPALKPDNQYLKYAYEKGKEVEMDMGIFLKYVNPQQIIGVTGTKGKSTTVSLIYNILKETSKKVTMAGNIRKSVLDILPEIKKDSLIVLELSSFQLEAFKQHKISPHLAVITNIFPDHLNYYGTMEKYIEAKRVIAQYQKEDDILFLPVKLLTDLASQVFDSEGWLAQTRRVDGLRGYQSHNNFTEGLRGQIKYFKARDLPKNFQPLLQGEHNLENMAGALAVVQTLGIDKIMALQVIKNFPGIEYRLQLVYNQNAVKIYNDSAATNPEATIQAIKSLPDSILICGGMDKGLPYDRLAQAINQYCKAVYFLEGSATEKIKNQILNIKNIDQKLKTNKIYSSLEEILQEIKTNLEPKNAILFSPAAASFNLFQNEFDRGEKFNQAVKKVFEKID